MFDERKSPINIKEKIIFKSEDIKGIMADAYALRYLEFIGTSGTKELISKIRIVTEEAHDLFGIPLSSEDSLQISDFVIQKCKELAQ